MRFEMLGPLRITVAGRELGLPPRERALLAALLLHSPNAVPTDQLIEAVWDEKVPQNARTQLQGSVHRLRRQFLDAGVAEPIIVTAPSGYRAVLGSAYLDVTGFRMLIAQARRHVAAGEQDQAKSSYREALALWRGPALVDIANTRIRPAAQALDEERTQAQEECMEAELAAGAAGALVAELTELVHQHPYREKLRAVLMLALYRAGRRADALAVFRDARTLLHGELGTEPSAELQQLHRAILNGSATVGAQPTAAGSTRPAGRSSALPVPRQLPRDVAGFTGRSELIEALDDLLLRPEPTRPLVISAIAGTAGVGKTALVVHWAHRATDRFPDGQLFVNLRGYGPDQPLNPADVLARLLDALGVASVEIPEDLDARASRYRSEVAGRRLLIVLDNAAGAEQVRPLLPGSGESAVVITSRDSLSGLVAVDGAHRMDVDLLTPTEATLLLRRLIGPRAAADPGATARLAEQCSRLPLALRVAAELVTSRPTARLADLVTELDDHQRRLELLKAGADTYAAVRTVFSWSIQQLPSHVARVFRLLGLHPGPDVDAYLVAALAEVSLDEARPALESLANAYLLHSASSGGYTMHDLLRAYARYLAGVEEDDHQRRAALDRLFDYCLAAAGQAMDVFNPAEAHRRPPVPTPPGPMPRLTDPDSARDWLDRNRPGLVAVTSYTACHGWPRSAIRLSGTLSRYLLIGGHYPEALQVHGSAKHAAEQLEDLPGLANALRHLGGIHLQMGHYVRASDHLQQALLTFQQIGDQDGEAAALNNLGLVEERLGNYRAATDLYQKALPVFAAIGEYSGVANTLNGLGVIAEKVGKYETAADHYRQSIATCQQVGNKIGEAIALHNLGNVEERLGRYDSAIERHGQATVMFGEIGHPQGQAHALGSLAAIKFRLHQPEEAMNDVRHALELFREIGDQDGEAHALSRLGQAAHAVGDLDAALGHYTDALGLATSVGLPDVEAEVHSGLGDTYRALGDAQLAGSHLRRAYRLYVELGRPEAEDIPNRLATLTQGHVA